MTSHEPVEGTDEVKDEEVLAPATPGAQALPTDDDDDAGTSDS
jgi:hypothetical protein